MFCTCQPYLDISPKFVYNFYIYARTKKNVHHVLITTISVAFMGIIIQVLKIPQQEYHIVASYFWGDIFNKHKQMEITPTFYRFSLHEKNEEGWFPLERHMYIVLMKLFPHNLSCLLLEECGEYNKMTVLWKSLRKPSKIVKV